MAESQSLIGQTISKNSAVAGWVWFTRPKTRRLARAVPAKAAALMARVRVTGEVLWPGPKRGLRVLKASTGRKMSPQSLAEKLNSLLAPAIPISFRFQFRI